MNMLWLCNICMPKRRNIVVPLHRYTDTLYLVRNSGYRDRLETASISSNSSRSCACNSDCGQGGPVSPVPDNVSDFCKSFKTSCQIKTLILNMYVYIWHTYKSVFKTYEVEICSYLADELSFFYHGLDQVIASCQS